MLNSNHQGNEIDNYWVLPLTLVVLVSLKKNEASFNEGVEKGIFMLCWRNVITIAIMRNSVTAPQSMKNRSAIYPSISLLLVYPEEMISFQRTICTFMFTVALIHNATVNNSLFIIS